MKCQPCTMSKTGLKVSVVVGWVDVVAGVVTKSILGVVGVKIIF